MSECRRCSDCIGCEHHWVDDLVFENGDGEGEPVGDHVCKHCPVCGLTCDDCDGEGCWACGNEGVKVVPGVTVEDYDA